jgi:V-type H+-transporting ATPase subunit d
MHTPLPCRSALLLSARRPSVMKTILAYEDLGEDFHSLYRTVLVDTPVGRYFTQFLQEVADEKAAADSEQARTAFADIPMTIVENSVKKFWLEDFHAFCAGLGGETAALMCELLAARADMLTVHITYNSLGSPDLGGGGRHTRASLFPGVGRLYPEGSDLLSRVDDEDGLRRAIARAVPELLPLWDNAPVDAVSSSGVGGRS